MSVLTDPAQLGAMADEWEALFHACERPSLCAMHPWIVAWWRIFGRGVEARRTNRTLFVVLARDSTGTLVAAFPFYEDQPAKASLRVRRLNGVGVQANARVYEMTEEPTGLVWPGWEERAVDALATLLRADLLRGRWDAVTVRFPVGVAPALLERAFGGLRSAFDFEVLGVPGSSVAPLPPTWGEYRKRLTRSMRDNFAYYPRLLERHGHRWSVRIVREPDEIRAAADRVADLHRARFDQVRGPRHSNHLHTPDHRAFLQTLLERLAEGARAFVGELVVDGEVVAAQAFVEEGEELVVFYSGYLEPWYRYSPLFVIQTFVFQAAQARGVRRINFLRASLRWVERWGASREPETPRMTLRSQDRAARARLGLQGAGTWWAEHGPGWLSRTRRRFERSMRKRLAKVREPGPPSPSPPP